MRNGVLKITYPAFLFCSGFFWYIRKKKQEVLAGIFLQIFESGSILEGVMCNMQIVCVFL